MQVNTLPFSIGILSWGSHKTLRNTLTSYRDNGLLDLTDDVIIYFQEITPEDTAIAEEYNIPFVIGSSKNIGIGAAFTKLVQAAKYENVMILENDWVLIEDKHTTTDVLEASVAGLELHHVDFIRLRHVKNPGDPLYTRQYMGREMDSPEHLMDSVHWLGESIAEKFSDIMEYRSFSDVMGFVIGDSFYSNHTNNSFMTTKKFYMEHIAPFGGEGNQLEGSIRDDWRSAHYIVAHNIPSLFTHLRLDR